MALRAVTAASWSWADGGLAPGLGLLGVGGGGLAGLFGEGFGAVYERVEQVCDWAGVVDVVVEGV